MAAQLENELMWKMTMAEREGSSRNISFVDIGGGVVIIDEASRLSQDNESS